MSEGPKILLYGINPNNYSQKLNYNRLHAAAVLSRVQPVAMPWTIAWQAPLSVESSRQEHWSGLPFPTPTGYIE